MKYRRRIFFTDEQKSDIWDRWQRGESMSSIGRLFDRESSSIYPLLARTGGIRPPDRVRSRLALTLSDREEISRGLRAQVSLRSIAHPSLVPGYALRFDGGELDFGHEFSSIRPSHSWRRHYVDRVILSENLMSGFGAPSRLTMLCRRK